ncbi:hypothetical protein ACHAXT_005596 [Thalassiosira profunda]
MMAAEEDTEAAAGGGVDVEDPVPITQDAPPPEQAPGASDAAGAKDDATDPSKKWKIILVSSFLVCTIALVIGLGVGLGNQDASAAGAGGGNNEGGCLVGDVRYQEGDSIGLIGLECVNETSYDGKASYCGPDGEIIETEEQFTCFESVPNCVQCGPRGEGAALCLSNTTTDRDCREEEEPEAMPTVYQRRYLKQNGPIKTKVRIIDPEVASGYETCAEAREDIRQALGHFANKIITEQTKYNSWYERCDPNNPNWNNHWGHDDEDHMDHDHDMDEEGAVMPELAGEPTAGIAFDGVAEESVAESVPVAAAPVPDSADAAGAAGGSTAAKEQTEDSFGTNNQVEGVKEADVVKSDGVHVFSAYGDLLYAWKAVDATQGMSITKMPYEENTETDCGPFFGPEPMPVDVAFEGVEPSLGMSTEESRPAAEATTTETVSISNPGSRQRKSLSMIEPGWGPCHQPKPRIVSLLLEGSRLTAIVSENTNRYYHGPILEGGREKLQPVIDYNTKLTARVYDVSDVPTDGSELTLVGEKEVKGDLDSARSIGSNVITITKMHVNTWQFAEDLYRHHLIAFLLLQPKYCGLNSKEYEDLASEIALANTEPFVDRLLDELELQLEGSCKAMFRIAAMQSGETTDDLTGGDMLQQIVQVQSFDMASDVAAFAATEGVATNVASAFSSGWLSQVYASQNFAATLSTGNSYDKTTGEHQESTFVLGFDLGSGVPMPLAYAEVKGTPLNQYSTDFYDGHLRTVTRQWTGWDPTSRTKNKIFILEVPKPGVSQSMTLVGETGHLGKPNEDLYAARFIGDKGYIVTFERIDPFYIIDLSNVRDPKVMGELEIPGFSTYLHPIQIDGVPLMLGVGEHVDPNSGQRTGVKISLFDVSDPYNPKESASFVDLDAYSSAGHDFHSFRYLNMTRKLILPKSKYTWSDRGNFDGFAVYDVNTTHITPHYQIQHASSYGMYHGCWYDAYMPPRSLVFASKLTTILSHTVKSTDLEDGEPLWNVTLGDGFTNNNCAPYFRPF